MGVYGIRFDTSSLLSSSLHRANGGVSMRMPALWRPLYCHCITDHRGSFAPLQNLCECSLDCTDTRKNSLDIHISVERFARDEIYLKKIYGGFAEMMAIIEFKFQCSAVHRTRTLTPTRENCRIFLHRNMYTYTHTTLCLI